MQRERHKYSLRDYLSILYLRLPPGFTIVLRGKAVQQDSIRSHMKMTKKYQYTPRGGSGGQRTDIYLGFAEEAPRTSVQGFCIYWKNRLIVAYHRQGLTLLQFTAQRKHIFMGYVGCMNFPQSIRQMDTGRCEVLQNGLG